MDKQGVTSSIEKTESTNYILDIFDGIYLQKH